MKSSAVQGTEITKFRETLVSNKVMSKETRMTYNYELLLKAFQLFVVSRRYRVPYSWGILKFGSN